MWEHHAFGIGWEPRLPTHRGGQACGIDAKEHQVGPAGVEPVGGQMHLRRSREVDEPGGLQRLRYVFAGPLGPPPLVRSAQVHKHLL